VLDPRRERVDPIEERAEPGEELLQALLVSVGLQAPGIVCHGVVVHAAILAEREFPRSRTRLTVSAASGARGSP
jgi:hypothetical protein